MQLDDVADKYTYPPRNQSDSSYGHSSDEPKGFVVSGAPWQQNVPNTNDTEEFPSMGGMSEAPKVNWGPKTRQS